MSHFAVRESEMSSDLALNESGQGPTPGVFVPPSNIFVLFFFAVGLFPPWRVWTGGGLGLDRAGGGSM